MAYYVSVIDGSKSVLALGPFNTHGAALAEVERTMAHVQATYKDAHWFGYGTSRVLTSRPAGKLNDVLSYAGPGVMP